MTRQSCIVALAVTLLMVSGCQRPPASQSTEKPAAEAVADAEVPPPEGNTSPPVPATGSIAPMLGMFAFTDDFNLDDDLRLEIIAPNELPTLRAYAGSIAGRDLLPDKTLQNWVLEPGAVEALIPHRVGMVIDCVSPSLRFQGRLTGYELWQDQTCSASYLIAVIEKPEDEQLNEPAIWVGLAHDPATPVVAVEESLEIHEASPPPANFLGFYEKTEQLIRDIAASTVTPAPEISSGEGGATLPPEPMMDVRFGHFVAGSEGQTAVVMGTWMQDAWSVRRALIAVDEQGNEAWRVPHTVMDRFALMGLQVEFIADLDADGFDEMVIQANTPSGARQAMIWSFRGQTLTVGTEGSWWGCDQRIPMLQVDLVEEGLPGDVAIDEPSPEEAASDPATE